MVIMTVQRAKCEPEPLVSALGLAHSPFDTEQIPPATDECPHFTHYMLHYYQAYSTHKNLSIKFSNFHPFWERTLVNIFNYKTADNLNHDHGLFNGFLISHSV